MHYMRWHTTGTTDARVWRYKCGLCGKDFGRSGAQGNFGINKFCSAKCRNRYRVITAVYHISVERYRELMAAGCAICAATDDLTIDHDHQCCAAKGSSCGLCIRSALCGDCNRAIGLMREDANRLRAAAAYVAQTRQLALFAAA
jgi:hypothetical protein